MNKLAAAYIKCIKIFVGYSKFSSVTTMLAESAYLVLIGLLSCIMLLLALSADWVVLQTALSCRPMCLTVVLICTL